MPKPMKPVKRECAPTNGGTIHTLGKHRPLVVTLDPAHGLIRIRPKGLREDVEYVLTVAGAYMYAAQRMKGLK